MNRKTYSPEMDTLEQLCGGNMSLKVVLKIYPDTASFISGTYGALKAGYVRLLENNEEVPEWRQRELFEKGEVLETLDILTLELTAMGIKHII